MIRPALVNSIPKAGTHLVSKALALIPGVAADYVRLAPAALQPKLREETVDIGIGLPRPASEQRVRETLAGLDSGQFALWHVPYSARFESMLRELELAMLIVVRDPRDVAVSHALHIAQFTGHRLHRQFCELSTDGQITAVVDGLRNPTSGDVLLESLANRYDHLLAWRRYEHVHLMRFEDVVGKKGGGTTAAQHSALRDMLQFLGLPATEEVIDTVAQRLFGETVTFRKGKIGGWREHLNREHVQHIEHACKDVMHELGYARSSARSAKLEASNATPPFIVNSFPKSGTKLLCKVCAMLPGVAPLPVNPRWRALSMMRSAWLHAPAEGTAGSKPTRSTTEDEAAQLLASIPPGRFIEHHTAHSPELAALLREHDVRMFMMVRDPHDAVVSLADYLAKAAHHPLHAFFQSLPERERLLRTIIGVRSDEADGPELSDVGTRYRRRVDWLNESSVEVIRFEELVGPSGGGDAERQRDAIRRILAHLNLEPSPTLVAQLADSSFGGTRTFHHGRIGRWREVFDDETLALFTGLAGDILERLGYDAEPT